MKTKNPVHHRVLLGLRRLPALAIIALAAFAAVGSLNASVIVGWNLSSDTGNTSANATTVDPNLSGTPVLSRGSGLSGGLGGGNSAGLMGGDGATDTSSGLSSANTAQTYFEFTLTPAAGKQLEIDSVTAPLTYYWYNQNDRSHTLYLASSLDNYATSLGSVTPSTSFGRGGWTINLSSPVISSTPVTFRIEVARAFSWETIGFIGYTGEYIPNSGPWPGTPTGDSLQIMGSVSAAGGSQPVATTTVLGSTPNPSGSGQSVTFTATVKTNGVTATGVTGDMVFKDGGTPVYTNSSPSGGVYTYSTSALTAGVHTFTAAYSGDANYLSSVSGATNQTVSPPPAPAGVIAYWDFTPSNYITAVPAGTAAFASPQDASVANSNVIVSALGAGASVHLDNNGNSIWNSECGYGTTISGDPGVLANVLNAGFYYDFTLQVAPGYTLNLTNITLSTGEGNASSYSYSSYVFSSLTGFNDTNVLGSGANGYLWTQYAATHLDLSPYSVDLSSANPKAGITLQNLTSASGTIEFRVYVGMPTYVQSGIQQLSLNGTVVAGYPKPATLTTLASSRNPSTNNQSFILTASVKTNGVSPVTAGNAGGTMVFSDNTGPLATNNVVNGIAKFTNSYALGGSYPIVATYSGDANYQSSYSATFNQLVNPTTTTLSVDVNPALVGDVVTFTATITPNEADYGSSAGGTVNFYDNGVLLQSVTSTPFPGYPDTVAIFQTFTSAGTHVITAVYQGAGDGLGLAPSTSAPLNETILEVSGLWATNTSAQVIDFDHTINNPSVGGNPGLDGQVLINVGPVAGPNSVQLYEPNAYGPTNSFSPMAWSVMGSSDNFGLGVGVPTSFGQDANGNAITTDRIDDYALQLVSNASTPSGNNPNFATFPSGQGNALLFNAASSFQSQKAITLRVVNGTGAKVAGWNLSLKAWDYGTNGPTALQVQTSPDNVNYTTSLLVANATNGPDATTLVSLGTLATSVGVPVRTNSVFYVRLNYPKPTNPSYAGNGFIIDDLSVQASTDASTTNTVASSISPSVFGQSVVLTDTVAPALTGGTVQFYDNGVALGSPVAVASGLAKLTNSLFTVTNHLITATYSGKTGSIGSYSTNTLTQTVNQAGTTSAVTSSANPAVSGTDDVIFTNRVTAVAPGSGIPTGTVTFKDNGTVLGTGTLDGSGVATYDAGIGLTAGSHPITAEYSGDPNFKGSTNNPAFTQTINNGGGGQAATTNVLTSSGSPALLGTSVTFTCTVSEVPAGGIPTGSVIFKDNGSVLATTNLDVTGAAQYSTTTLTPGGHVITAEYAGDGSNLGSTNSPALVQVILATTTNVLTSSQSQAMPGSSVTFIATLTELAPGIGIPTGNVIFKDNGTNPVSVALSASGTATNTTAALTPGSHAITAEYVGDSANLGSTNNPALTQIILIAPTVSNSKLSAGTFQVTFNGSAGQTYEVLSTTNVAQAIALWVTNSSGTFNGSPVTYTNSSPTGQKFYRIKSP